MKKFLVLFLIALITVSFTSTTRGKISYGTPVKKFTLRNYIGNIGEDVYIEGDNKKKPYVVVMNKLKLKSKTQIAIGINNEAWPYKYYIINNRLFVIYGQYIEEKNSVDVSYTELDANTLSPIGDSRLIGNFSFSNYSDYELHMAVSPNKKYTLLMANFYSSDKKRKGKVIYVVLDKELNAQRSKDQILPYSVYKSKFSSATIDDNGFVVVISQSKAIKHAVTDPNLVQKVFVFDNDNHFEEKVINPKGIQILELKAGFNAENKLICSGFYTTAGNKGYVGSFGLKYDIKSGKIISIDTKEFESNFISQSLSRASNKPYNPHKKDVYTYKIHDLLKMDNGGFVIAAEEYFSKPLSNQFQYFYNDILLINVDKDGNVIWNKKIVKRQNHSLPERLSYAISVKKNDVYVLYNDNTSNRNLHPGLVSKAYGGNKNSDLILIHIPEGKDIEKVFVTSNRGQNFLMSPFHYYFSKDNNTFYLEGGYSTNLIYPACVGIVPI